MSGNFEVDDKWQPCLVWQHTFVSPSAFSRRAVVSYWRKYVHEVLVNRLGGLSLPRKSVVRLTDRPDMTIDIYRGRKTTIQQQQLKLELPEDLTIAPLHCSSYALSCKKRNKYQIRLARRQVLRKCLKR